MDIYFYPVALAAGFNSYAFERYTSLMILFALMVCIAGLSEVLLHLRVKQMELPSDNIESANAEGNGKQDE